MFIEGYRFPDAHAGRSKEAEQRRAGSGPQWLTEVARLAQQRGDLGVRVDVRRLALPLKREQVRRRDLRAGIGGVVVLGEPANGPQLRRPPIRVAIDRLLGPAQGQL